MAEIGESASSSDISSQGTVDSDDSTFEETEAYSGRQQEYLGARPYSFEPRIEKKEDCEAGDEDGAHVDPRDCGDISRLQNVEWYRDFFTFSMVKILFIFPNIIIESVGGWCKLQLAMGGTKIRNNPERSGTVQPNTINMNIEIKHLCSNDLSSGGYNYE